jgi:hypothetical protein
MVGLGLGVGVVFFSICRHDSRVTAMEVCGGFGAQGGYIFLDLAMGLDWMAGGRSWTIFLW